MSQVLQLGRFRTKVSASLVESLADVNKDCIKKIYLGWQRFYMVFLKIVCTKNFGRKSVLNSSGIEPLMVVGDLNKLSSSQDKLVRHKGNCRYNKFLKFLMK